MTVKEKTEQQPAGLVIIKYTILFALMFTLCYGWMFAKYHKSMFWGVDGLAQHYALVTYTGNYIRELFSALVHEHRLVFPMWDFSMGYGSDIFVTLGVGMFDPVNWLAALVPMEKMEFVFNLMVIGKMYLAGLAFIAFCRHMKQDDMAALAGSVMYVFSGVLYIAFYHLDFINIYYLFPLLLIGVDKLWSAKFSPFYVLILAFTFINHFYFGYMSAVFIAGWCLIRFVIGDNPDRRLKNLLVMLVKYLFSSLLSFGMALFAFLTPIMNLTGTDRLKITQYIPKVYDVPHLENTFSGMVLPWNTGNDSLLGFGAAAFVVLLLLFWIPKKFKVTKVSLVLLGAGYILPYFGHIMNGFSYASNRWVFALLFLICFGVVEALPHLGEIKSWKYIVTLAILVLYGVIGYRYSGYRNEVFLLSVILCLAVLIYVWIIGKWKGFSPLLSRGVLVSACVSSLAMSLVYWSPFLVQNNIATMVDADTAYSQVMDSFGLPLLEDKDPSDGLRFNSYDATGIRNSSWVSKKGFSGTDFYEPYYNNDIDVFHKDLYVNTPPFSTSYNNLDRRSTLLSLMGVEYMILPEESLFRLPYGYSQFEKSQKIDGRNYCLYTPAEKTGLIHVFDQSISQNTWDKLNPEEKEQALSQAVVLEEGLDNEDALEIKNHEVPYTVSAEPGITFRDNTFIVEKPESRVTLSFDMQTNSQVYLMVKNLQLKDNIYQFYAMYADGGIDGNIIPELAGSAFPSTNRTHMYGAKHDWMINYGNLQDREMNTIMIAFDQPGTYTIDDLKIFSRSHEELQEALQSLSQKAVNIKLDTNVMYFETNSHKEQIYLISEPFSKGWKAEIDGKKVEILKADDAFMAIKVPAGTHKVQMTYRSPYLYESLFISVISLLVYVILCLFYLKKKHSKIIKT